MSNARRLTATHLPPSLAEADRASVNYWIPVLKDYNDRFEGSLRSSLSHAIELGKQLIAAKEALPHGEFGQMFSDHPDNKGRASPLGMTQSWANKVMRIAAQPVLTNSSHETNLPADLNTVFELASMTAPALEAAIESGRVHPAMTRAEAKAVKNEAAEADPESSPRPRAARQRDPSEVLVEQISNWCDWLQEFLDNNPSPVLRSSARVMIQNLTKIAEARR